VDKVTLQAREMYNEYRFGRFNYGQKRIDTEPLLLEFLSMVKPGNALFDIGCGEGFWIQVYLAKGIIANQMTLIDLAPENADELIRKGFKASCGSVLALPFENNVADYTICNGVIHHTADPYKAFTELVRITKPGGYIYLNVYNIWNFYYLIVHKATFPIRWYYWNVNKKILDIVYPPAKLFFQPLAYLTFRQFLDDKTGKTMFMDQVITPRADLFSKSKIRNYAQKNSCVVEKFAYNKGWMMIAAVIKVMGKHSILNA